MSAPEPLLAAVPEPDSLRPIETTPSLREMAETEQREDLAVNVAAAVAATRAAVRTHEEQPASPVAPPDPAPDPAPLPTAADTGVSESHKIKERMMRASRARRKERPDLVTASTDPVLPDWYEPDLDEPDGATRSAGDFGDR